MTTIEVKSCANNIFDNLVALGGSGKMQGGFIMPSQKQVDELTACPWLRFFLTCGWPDRKGWTCLHPDLLGKRTQQKSVHPVSRKSGQNVPNGNSCSISSKPFLKPVSGSHNHFMCKLNNHRESNAHSRAECRDL